MHAVLVHGILDTGWVFRPLIKHLESEGIQCLAPSLTPNDARHGLEPLAAQLAEAIDRSLGPDTPINLVGFSMGGLISRYYLQELAGHRRVRRFFAIATPMAGTLWSHLAWGQGVMQMRPESAFLWSLEQSAGLLDGVELYTYWTPFDLVIVPQTSAVWERAENTRLLAPCHPCLLWSSALAEHMVARIKADQKPAADASS